MSENSLDAPLTPEQKKILDSLGKEAESLGKKLDALETWSIDELKTEVRNRGIDPEKFLGDCRKIIEEHKPKP